MEQVYVPLLSALAGAIIGSATSILTIIVQARYQAKRERTRVAVEAGIEEFKFALEMSKRHSGPGPFELFPLGAFILFHAEMLKELEAGTLTPETMTDIYRRQSEMLKVIAQASKEAARPKGN